MNVIKKIWEFLNGKKTLIGGVICFISVFLSEVICGIWGVHTNWLPPLIKTLNWIGMPLVGIGGVHKGIKAAKKE